MVLRVLDPTNEMKRAGGRPAAAAALGAARQRAVPDDLAFLPGAVDVLRVGLREGGGGDGERCEEKDPMGAEYEKHLGVPLSAFGELSGSFFLK